MTYPIMLIDAANSFAVQAIERGPRTIAPPSFEGHGWLVVINIVMTTAPAILALMLAGKLVKDWYRHGAQDPWPTPTAIYRTLGIAGSLAVVIACGMEALTLWGYNPRDPEGTAWYLTAQRLVAPIGRAFTFSWIGLYVLAEPAMIEHLRKQPFPLRMWPRLRLLYRPAMIVLLALIAAVGVVSTR